MVTGVETAGLVLAALPLIVEGLQGYLKGIHTIQRFFKMEKWVKQYLANVENCEVVVRQFIERVLLESEADVDVDELLDGPGGDLWQDPGLEKQLRKYLGRYYEKYMQTIGDLCRLIDELREKLHLNRTLPAQARWYDPERVKDGLRKMKTTMTVSQFDEMFEQIQHLVATIRDLTNNQAYMETARLKGKRKQSRPFLTHFRLVREQVASLHRALTKSSLPTCSCRRVHVLSLRLEKRPKSVAEPQDISSLSCQYRLLFSSLDRVSERTMAVNWHELEITPIEIEHKPQEESNEITTGNRQVRFEVPRKPSPLSKPPKEKREGKGGPMIHNICSAMLTPPIASGRQHLGFICEAESLSENSPSHTVKRLANQTLLKSATLGDLLEMSSRGSSIVEPMPLGDRLSIAVAVASNFLQLCGTSWINDDWNSKSVMIYYQEAPNMNGFAIKNVHPYVDWKSESPGSTLPEKDLRGPLIPRSLGFWVRSASLAALGLTLIEICLGRTLESIARERNGSALSDSDIAKSRLELGSDLVKDVYRCVFSSYGQVIERCLRCPWECDVSDIGTNDDFQHHIFEDIVKPLANDYDHFCGKENRVY